MVKKSVLILLVLSCALLCGCDNSKRIDKAIIVECIAVGSSDYKFIYISQEEKSESVTIKAESLENALSVLKTEHKSEVVISNLGLLAFAKNTPSSKIYEAVNRIKNDYSVSPSVYTAICSDEIIDNLENPKLIDNCYEQIMLLEKKETDVSSTLLKLHNNLNKYAKGLIYLPNISSNDGIKGEKIEIMIKK